VTARAIWRRRLEQVLQWITCALLLLLAVEVLAGVIFAAHGRTSWGLTERRAEGLADCEARAQAYGLGAIRWPAQWPTSDLLVARGMLVAERRGSLQRFALEAMRISVAATRSRAEHRPVSLSEVGQPAHAG